MILKKKILFEGSFTQRELSIIHLALYNTAVEKIGIPEDVVLDMQDLFNNIEVLEPELQINGPMP